MSKPINVNRLKGLFTPIITPVDAEGAIDTKKLSTHACEIVKRGVDGILAFGSNSEFYMFDDEEMLAATQVLIEAVGEQASIMFGIGHIRTSKAVGLAKEAAHLDIDAISVLQPMFIKPTPGALYRHFRTIAEAVPNTAMFIYNNPGRTGYAVPIDIIVKLAHDVPNIVGIKDSSGNITNCEELVRQTKDVDFNVFVGKDTAVFPGLCCGAVGAVCSTANIFPELVCGIYDKFMAGDYEGSKADQFKLNPIRLSQDMASFPAATKDMANLLGMDVGPSVLPTEATTGSALEGMKRAMRDAGYLKD
jgi:4-hydroxy-tetrahydrodipicolinate synthase